MSFDSSSDLISPAMRTRWKPRWRNRGSSSRNTAGFARMKGARMMARSPGAVSKSCLRQSSSERFCTWPPSFGQRCSPQSAQSRRA